MHTAEVPAFVLADVAHFVEVGVKTCNSCRHLGFELHKALDFCRRLVGDYVIYLAVKLLECFSTLCQFLFVGEFAA